MFYLMMGVKYCLCHQVHIGNVVILYYTMLLALTVSRKLAKFICFVLKSFLSINMFISCPHMRHPYVNFKENISSICFPYFECSFQKHEIINNIFYKGCMNIQYDSFQIPKY